MIHVSNFRPVKRVAAAVEVFARSPPHVPCPPADGRRWAGSGRGVVPGPRAGRRRRRAVRWRAGSGRAAAVRRPTSFLLPSAQESFGLAALEAMACEVPVVASRVGGLPEVIEDGVTGFLHAPDDLDGMAESAFRLLTDEELHRRAAEAARRVAHERFCDSKIVPIYEAYYRRRVLAASVAGRVIRCYPVCGDWRLASVSLLSLSHA